MNFLRIVAKHVGIQWCYNRINAERVKFISVQTNVGQIYVHYLWKSIVARSFCCRATSQNVWLSFKWVKNFCSLMNRSAAENLPAVLGRFFQPQFGRINPGFVLRFKLPPISFPEYTQVICTCKLKFCTVFVWQRGCISRPILRVTFRGPLICQQKPAAKTGVRRMRLQLIFAADSRRKERNEYKALQKRSRG